MATWGWIWEPSAVCWQSYVESPSRFAPLGTPERQSLCESHRQRRWLTYWSYVEQRYYCTTCRHTFSIDKHTFFETVRRPRLMVVEALALLGERNSLRA